MRERARHFGTVHAGAAQNARIAIPPPDASAVAHDFESTAQHRRRCHQACPSGAHPGARPASGSGSPRRLRAGTHAWSIPSSAYGSASVRRASEGLRPDARSVRSFTWSARALSRCVATSGPAPATSIGGRSRTSHRGGHGNQVTRDRRVWLRPRLGQVRRARRRRLRSRFRARPDRGSDPSRRRGRSSAGRRRRARRCRPGWC